MLAMRMYKIHQKFYNVDKETIEAAIVEHLKTLDNCKTFS